jgi:DNA-binding NarL/FixJ family response regulator
MKVLIADDHPVLRAGLAALMVQIGPDTVVLQAGDAEQALALVTQHADLDVVVLDLAMPGMGGLPAIAEFGRIRPDLPVIVLSSSEDPQDVRKAFAEGALGYVPKSAGQQTLLSAVRLVLNGDIYVPPAILMEPPGLRLTDSGSSFGSGSLLTERQIDVLRRLGEGQSNREIALELGLSEKTVKAHVSAVFKALRVVSRTQATAAGRKAGLI